MKNTLAIGGIAFLTILIFAAGCTVPGYDDSCLSYGYFGSTASCYLEQNVTVTECFTGNDGYSYVRLKYSNNSETIAQSTDPIACHVITSNQSYAILFADEGAAYNRIIEINGKNVQG